MKKVKTLRSPRIWEPANNRRALRLPKPMGVFDVQPQTRMGECQRIVNPGGRLHCGDGPAVVFEDGGFEWWRDGKLHRDDDQPAAYFQEGNSFTTSCCSGFVGSGDSPFRLSPETEVWCKDGLLHREGKPAVKGKFADGTFRHEYWCDGRRHNSDGAAVRTENLNFWFYHGLLHREDGPAIVSAISSTSKTIWVWYGHVLVNNGKLTVGFPFENPPATYLLKALLMVDFSSDLAFSLPLMLPYVIELMPNFESDVCCRCDPTSWDLAQAFIRKLLNTEQSEGCYDLPAGAFDEV